MIASAPLLLALWAVLPDQQQLGKIFIPAIRANALDKDGSTTEPWGGVGENQIKISKKYLAQRDEQLARAAAVLKQLDALMTSATAAKTNAERKKLREQILALTDSSLGTVDEALTQALEFERKRLWMVTKASQNAAERTSTIPGVDPKVAQQLLDELDAGKDKVAVKVHVEGFRNMARGFAAFLGNDLANAMMYMELAVRDLPDFAAAHQYLGSFYFLARDQHKALAEWRIALKLDPDNAELKKAVEDQAKVLAGE